MVGDGDHSEGRDRLLVGGWGGLRGGAVVG